MGKIDLVVANVVACLDKYAVFEGRATRSEYWSFALVFGLANWVLNILYRSTGFRLFSVVAALLSLLVLVPSLAVSWRRLHDIGKKGSWYFIIFVPIVGVILMIVWCCRDSQPGDNEYGPNPKSVY
jgi:uncharacterized membrane protein YhaH (DUF805 family)